MNLMTPLQDAAAWAWHTSLMVAVPGLILLALGHWRGFSARWRMVLAGALLLRLLLPDVPGFAWHPASAWQMFAPAPVATLSAAEVAALLRESASIAQSEAIAAPVTAAFPWPVLLTAAWALGVFIVGSWLVVSHWRIRRWVSREATDPDAHVASLFQWSCGRMGMKRRIGLAGMPIATAAVCGWLRPIVLVPAELHTTHSDDEIRGILLHELAHVRRYDVLWSWLGLAACAMHWFNPLAWLALRRFHADRELECDRMALEKLPAPQRSAYAPALFKTLAGPALTAPAAVVPFFRHKHEIHTRIRTIMKPTTSLLARLAALTVIPALSLLTLTAGADEAKPSGKTTPESGTSGKPAEESGVKRTSGERDDEGVKAEAAVAGNAVVLRITGTGETVTVNKETIPMKRLRGYLNEHLDADRATPLIVEAEATVPYKAATDVLDAAKDNRVKNVSFRTLKP